MCNYLFFSIYLTLHTGCFWRVAGKQNVFTLAHTHTHTHTHTHIHSWSPWVERHSVRDKRAKCLSCDVTWPSINAVHHHTHYTRMQPHEVSESKITSCQKLQVCHTSGPPGPRYLNNNRWVQHAFWWAEEKKRKEKKERIPWRLLCWWLWLVGSGVPDGLLPLPKCSHAASWVMSSSSLQMEACTRASYGEEAEIWGRMQPQWRPELLSLFICLSSLWCLQGPSLLLSRTMHHHLGRCISGDKCRGSSCRVELRCVFCQQHRAKNTSLSKQCRF